MHIENHTGQPLNDFDIMINKNPFAIFVAGQANKITLPAPGANVYGVVPCTIEKKNADAKNPPKFPFMVQVAMRTSRDVFFFNVPCMVHCLLSPVKELTKEEFKQYWEKIATTNQSEMKISNLYAGYRRNDLAAAVPEGISANLFKQ